jgi:hypothetical protein
MLKTNPCDFSSPASQKQTDGELYYKTITEKGKMPAYEKKSLPRISVGLW